MNEERRDKYVKFDKYVKIKGKEIILKYEEWRTLLERFDPCNIKHTQDGYCYIEKPCICFNYDGRCFKCPFGKLGQSGCLDAIRSIEPKFVKKLVAVNRDAMKWKEEDNFEVMNMLMKIYVALREMKNYYETKPYVIDYTKTEPFYIKYINSLGNYYKKNDFPREIRYSPRMYGKASRITATEAIRLIRSIENELDELRHLVKFYTEGEYKISKSLKKRLEDDKEYQIQAMKEMREERKKRGLPF